MIPALFILLELFIIGGLISDLIKPRSFKWLLHKKATKFNITLIWIALAIICLVIVGGLPYYKSIFLILALLSIIGFFAGLINPQITKFIFKKNTSTGLNAIFFLSVMIVFFIIFGVIPSNNNKIGSKRTNNATSSYQADLAKEKEEKKAAEEAKKNAEAEKKAAEEAKRKAEEEAKKYQPINLSGYGQKATDKFTLQSGLSIFKMNYSGSSNFAIWLIDSNGKEIELLVNKIGNFDGSKAVGIVSTGDYLLDVTADANWSVNITQPR